jgi:hypothetical protein
MALDSLDKVVTALASGRILPFYKTGPATTGAGVLESLWRSAGFPAPGSIPSTALICTDDTVGAWQINGTGSLMFNVYSFQPIGSAINQWMLYDRLIARGGLLHGVVTTTPVSITLVDVSNAGRCLSTGSDVEWFVEIYTDIGVTACSVVIQYTDQNGVARSIAVSIWGASPLNQDGRLYQIVPQAPSQIFIKSVEERRQVTSSAVSGNYGIIAMKKLAIVPQMIANVGGPGDWASIGLPQIMESSCLCLVALASTTAVGNVTGMIKIAQQP